MPAPRTPDVNIGSLALAAIGQRYEILGEAEMCIRDSARGVPIGGISAGLAVQGQFVFTAMEDTVKSPEALANPYDSHVTLARDFLTIPALKGVITDSHFSQRERMGRSIAFLARIVQDGWAKEVHGIGIDETTAVLVDADGHARVVGENSAYFMTLDHRPEICVDGKPLTVRHVKVWKLSAGAEFDLKSWTGPEGTAMEADVVDGKDVYKRQTLGRCEEVRR